MTFPFSTPANSHSQVELLQIVYGWHSSQGTSEHHKWIIMSDEAHFHITEYLNRGTSAFGVKNIHLLCTSHLFIQGNSAVQCNTFHCHWTSYLSEQTTWNSNSKYWLLLRYVWEVSGSCDVMFMHMKCMVPGRRLPHPIQLAFPWIFCGTFFQDNSLLILKTCQLPHSPGLMVPDKL